MFGTVTRRGVALRRLPFHRLYCSTPAPNDRPIKSMIGLAGVGLATMMLMLPINSSAAALEETKEKKPVLTQKFSYYSGRGLKDPKQVSVFTGTGNAPLARDIAKYLGTDLGDVDVSKFADGEISIKVNENVRGKSVVIIQSTCPPNINDNFVELLLLVSTMRRASAKSITVVLPYYAYARADQKRHLRQPIAARDTMQMLETMGVDRMLCVDMHSGQFQGFLSPNVTSDNITAIKVGALYFSEMNLSSNLVVVAPNAKAVSRAKDFWNVLLRRKKEARFAMVLRKPILGEADRKEKDRQNKLDTGFDYEVVGDENVSGCDAIIVSDIVDSAESICASAEALKENGAKRVFCFATHGLFSQDAISRIEESPALNRVYVTNSASTQESIGQNTKKIEWISIAPLLAEAIRRVSEKESLAPLFALPAR